MSKRFLLSTPIIIGLLMLSIRLASANSGGSPLPEATLTGLPTSVFIGECFDFAVAFDNASTNPSDVGYGPYIDLIMPFDGNDGAGGTDTPDGISFNGATYLGADVTFIELTFPASGTVTHPLTGLPVTGSPGDQLVVLEMPFGSFVPDQPPATVSVNACLSDLADIGVDLPITATAGFQYGNEATGSTPIIGTSVSADVTPILMTLTKSFSGTENQTATGPNWVQSWTIDIDIAAGQLFTDFVLLDNLPNNVVYLGIVSTIPAAYTVQDEPPLNEPINGSELRLLFDSVNGDDDVSVTFEFFVPEFDADGNPILPPATGGCVEIDNDALVESGNWSPIDDRDDDEPIYSDDANPDQTFDACALVIHKSVAIFDDDPPTGASANDVLEYGYQVNVSDYFTLGGPGNGPTQAMSLVIDDVISDGQLFDSTFKPTFTAEDRYADTGSSFTAGAVFSSGVPSVNLVVDDSLQPAGVWPTGSFYQEPRACGDGTTALQFDLSQQLIDDARLGVTYNVIGGGIDIVEDNVIDLLDDGMISATDIISGGVDLNNDGVIDTLDAGTFFGYTVIDGYLDYDGSGTVDSADNGTLVEANVASLVGGCVVPGSPNPDDTIDTPGEVVVCLPGSAELQTPATVTVDYRTVVQDVYSCPVPSGDQSLDQGDSLSNDVDMDADVLDNEEPDDPSTGVTQDGSGAGISIPVGEVSKEVYARNGDTMDTGPFSPGDEITYLLRYTMPRSDFEDFSLTDYFPLPILQVDDHNADNTPGDAWDLSALTIDTGTITAGVVACDTVPAGTPPPSGSVVYGAGDTYHCHPGPSIDPDPPADPTVVPPPSTYVEPLTPMLGIDTDANSLMFTYGTYDNVPNASSVIELLITLTVQDDPFVDGLFLTNQVRSYEENSFNDATPDDAIVQFQINEPELNIRKGVVGTDNPNADIQPEPIIPTGTTLETVPACPRIGGTPLNPVTSANLPGTFDSNLTGGDAGDVVTYAIVVENTGAGQNGAFDVNITDALPAGITVSDVNAGSLCVQLGDGTPLAETTNWTGDLFTTGIELVDPDETAPTLEGALAPGKSTDDVENAVGDNIVIITYDVTLPITVEPGTSLTNTASVTNYASLPNGENFVDLFGPIEDDATVATTIPTASKAVIDSEINSASNGQFDVVIGEIVTYTLTVTVPEGTTPAAQFVDTLDAGLAFVGCASVTASADVTSSLTCNEPTNPTVASPGQTVTWSFGDIVNANTDDTVADTITIVYQAVVLNVSGNQGAPDTNTTLDNTATFSWNVGESDETALPAVQADPVTVIEPILTVDKSVVVDGAGTVGDAGDTVVYTIVIEHDANSETDAWDLVISDTIPALIENPSITVNPGDAFEIVGGVLQLKASSNVDLALGSSLTIEVTGTLSSDVEAGETISNTVDVEWTSLDGDVTDVSPYNDDSDERDGTGGINDYATSDSADLTIDIPAIDKEFVNSNQDFTTDPEVAIGEIITYSITITVPEGITLNAQLADTLDEGLAFVDCVSVTAAASSGDLTTSIGGWGDACNDPTNPVITDIGADPSGEGRVATFDLGTITNSSVDGIDDTITLVYRAVVVNSLGNDRGDTLTNAATLTFDGGSVSDSAPDVVIVEPELIIDKVATPSTGDAGDLVTFELDIRHAGASNSDAFNAVMVDDIPALLNYETGTLDCNLGTLNPTTCVVVGTIITATWDVFPDTGLITVIQFDVRLDDDVTAGTVLTNTATTTWTGLPGDVTTPQSDYSSISTERTGDPNDPGGDANDYTTSDADSVTVSGEPIKSIVATSEDSTIGTTLTIGEIVRYRLVYKIPEGSYTNFQMLDRMPSGLLFLDDGTAKVAFVSNNNGFSSVNGSNSTSTIADPSAFVDGNEINVASITPAFVLPASAISSAGTTGSDVTFSLGDFQNLDDNGLPPENDDSEYVVIEFNALVANIADNNSGDVEVNYFEIYNNGALTETSNDQSVTLAEPDVSITKTLTTTPVDAGDTVVYRFEVVNATGATVSDAFDLLVVDQLNALLQIQAVTVTVGAPTVYTDTSTIGGVDVNVELSQLQPGQTAIIEVEAIVLVTAPPNAVITNTVDLTYTSLPDGGTVDNPTGSNTPGGSSDDDGERDGSDGTGGVNDYVDDSDASFTLDGYTVEKLFESSSADHTTDPFVTIGEVVTYTLIVTLPEGTMPAVVLTDTLPDGMQYVGYELDTSGFAGTITNDPPTVFTAGGSGDDVRFEFGDIVVTANNDSADNTFSVLVSAVVLDVSGNVGYPPNQTDLDNGVSLQVDDGPVVTDGPVTVTVVEPRMEIDKRIDPNVAQVGGVVTVTLTVSNTGTSTAFEVSMSDPLPTGLTYAGGLDCNSGSLNPTICDEAGNTVSATWASFAVGDITIIQFQATVNGDVNPGPIVNTATVTDATTLPGDDPNERDEPDDEDSDEVLVVNPSIDIQKTVYRDHDSGQSCAGEELQYGQNGDVVTYCFVVTNTGDTYLDSIELSDPDLGVAGITTADMILLDAPGTFPPLAPNETITYYYQTTIDGDLLNTVSVTANPTDDMGGDLTGVDDVSDDDTAEVIEIAPAIDLEKTVYAGHDDGAGCVGGELASGVTTAPVTYCFVVTNTGDTVLSNVVIDDSDLGITTTQMTLLSSSSTFPPLGIGETITYYYQTTITEDLLNTATVTGTPSDDSGTPLSGADDVTDTDTAEVDLLTPAIEIEKTVYAGYDDGAQCEGSELVEASNGSAVTYCFVVINRGDTYLDSIVITDTLLGIDQSDMTLIVAQSDLPLPLAPLGELYFYYETTISGDLINTAETEGNPTDSSGTDLPNGVNPTDSDTAEVVVENPTAVGLRNTGARGFFEATFVTVAIMIGLATIAVLFVVGINRRRTTEIELGKN